MTNSLKNNLNNLETPLNPQIDAHSEAVERRAFASLVSPSGAKRGTTKLSLTPSLTQLAVRGTTHQLEAVLEEGAHDIDELSPNGSTPLVLAAKYGRLDAVKLLLKYGATSVTAALMVAMEFGHQEVIEFLSNL